MYEIVPEEDLSQAEKVERKIDEFIDKDVMPSVNLKLLPEGIKRDILRTFPPSTLLAIEIRKRRD